MLTTLTFYPSLLNEFKTHSCKFTLRDLLSSPVQPRAILSVLNPLFFYQPTENVSIGFSSIESGCLISTRDRYPQELP